MTRSLSAASTVVLVFATIVGSAAIADPDPFLHQTSRELVHIVGARSAHALIGIVDVRERRRGLSGWYHFDAQGTDDDDFPVKLDARSYQPMLGADYVAGRLTVGAAAGYNGVDAAFRADSGAPFFPTESVNADLWSIAPYVSYAFDEHFFATLVGAYQRQLWNRFDTLIPDDLDADAGFWDASLHAIGFLGDDVVLLQGDVGVTHHMLKRSRQSVAHDFIGTAALDAALPLGRVAPYARTWYELAVEDGDSHERHTFYVGAGLRFEVSESVSFDVGGWTGVGHRDLRESNLGATLRFQVP